MKFKSVTTTCPYCACGCGLVLEVMNDRIVCTQPSKTSPSNRGKLCIKGWNVHEFIQHPDRLKKPLVRKNGVQTETSWDEALGYAAAELRGIREKHGPDSIGFLTSARCTNEENYILQKFARTAIGTNNVDHCARL